MSKPGLESKVDSFLLSSSGFNSTFDLIFGLEWLGGSTFDVGPNPGSESQSESVDIERSLLGGPSPLNRLNQIPNIIIVRKRCSIVLSISLRTFFLLVVWRVVKLEGLTTEGPGIAWRSVVPDAQQRRTCNSSCGSWFYFSAFRFDYVIGEGKGRLELRGEELRYGLAGRVSAIALEFLDYGDGGEMSCIQSLRSVKKRRFPSSKQKIPSERPNELPSPTEPSRDYVWLSPAYRMTIRVSFTMACLAI